MLHGASAIRPPLVDERESMVWERCEIGGVGPFGMNDIYDIHAEQRKLTTLVLELHNKFDATFTLMSDKTKPNHTVATPMHEVLATGSESNESRVVPTPPLGELVPSPTESIDSEDVMASPICETEKRSACIYRTSTQETALTDLEGRKLSIGETLASSLKEFSREMSFARRIAKDHAKRHASKQKQGMDNWLGVLVTNPKFDTAIIAVVAINSLIVGCQVEQTASGSTLFKNELIIAEYACSLIFVCELFCRVVGLGRMVCSKDQRPWLTLDVILVASSITDFVMEYLGEGDLARQGSSIGQIMKVARLMRVLRIFRFVRFLTKVRLMVTMICGSMLALFWLFVLILFVLYAFSIVLTLRAAEWLEEQATSSTDEVVRLVRGYYGSMPGTMYTLYTCMTGGINWGEPANVALVVGIPDFCIFLGFMFFIFFSVLNIVTGVFVDGAIQHANGDRSLRAVQAEEQQAAYLEDLRDLMLHLDLDGDGAISLAEWEASVEIEAVRTLLHSLDIKINDAMNLFQLLDVNGDGQITVYELMTGMSKCKGFANAVDMHAAIASIRKVRNLCNKIADAVGADCADEWMAGRRKGVPNSCCL
eukprot:TRINITY_DN56304_c0_g1_i1.p1 TRINITY_DN56304_c0_g1~~TRINITY_DN56304_c0_g1_i1.p1  ORF type:complete len:594 (+),score=72.40 TRINITY_DN56304_c0_g1_i1:156-1937(+)